MKNLLDKQNLPQELIILGIDPGTTVIGFGLIKIICKQVGLIIIDELLLKQYTHHSLKLKKIFEKTLSLIDSYHPNELAIESPFFGKNVQSMLKLGRAQGVAMAAGLYRGVPITEYSPKKIKMAITGNGNASKEQVAKMLQTLLHLKESPIKNLDASDGLAAAMCHYLNRHTPTAHEQHYNGWATFVKENTGRIKNNP